VEKVVSGQKCINIILQFVLRGEGMVNFNKIEDEGLLAMCKSGDEDAWRYAYNYILTICSWNKWNLGERAADLAQDITLHIIDKALKKIKFKDKFRKFIKQTAIYKIKDSFKTKDMTISINQIKKNNEDEEIIMEFQDDASGPEEVYRNHEIVSIVDEALSRMSSPCREILTEYFKYKIGKYEDYQELSEVLNMPVPTISSRVTRCMKVFLKFDQIRNLNT
jgi:RNA polymerase sigma factor (sigma-70 family)